MESDLTDGGANPADFSLGPHARQMASRSGLGARQYKTERKAQLKVNKIGLALTSGGAGPNERLVEVPRAPDGVAELT